MKLKPSTYLQFITGGRATFTIVSHKTGTRFTYRVSIPSTNKPEDSNVFFVSVLTGSDNTHDYTFMSCIFRDPVNGTFKLVHPRKSRISADAPSAVAFAYLCKYVFLGMADRIEIDVYHEGKCCRCGRKLTVPESIESGIGPECASIKEGKSHHHAY